MRLRQIAVAVLACVVMAACASQQDSSDVAAGTPDAPRADADLSDFLGHLRAVGMEAEQYDSPGDWADAADLTVAGTVLEIRPGRSFASGEGPPAFSTFHLVVDVTEWIRGERRSAPLVVELVGDAKLDADAASAMLPIGTRVMAFLSDFTDPRWERLDYLDGGKPADAIYAPHANGIFFVEDDTVVPGYQELVDLGPDWPGLGHVDDFMNALSAVSDGQPDISTSPRS